jgi:DNA polymerase delta subunit 1
VSKGVLCLQETPGYEWFDSEDTMLLAFAKKIVDFNPDFVTGFNSNNFDMPYIIDRMKMLRIHNIAGMFSRRKGFIVDYRREYKQSKQFGTKEVVNYVIPGRVMFDQMEIIKGNPMIRLRSYSLKSICAEYLGDDNKEDLAYREIPTLFQTTEGRQRIASYCLQDSLLLKKLDDKMMLGLDIASQARVQMITPPLRSVKSRLKNTPKGFRHSTTGTLLLKVNTTVGCCQGLKQSWWNNVMRQRKK